MCVPHTSCDVRVCVCASELMGCVSLTLLVTCVCVCVCVYASELMRCVSLTLLVTCAHIEARQSL